MRRSFSNLTYTDEHACVEALLRALPWDSARAARVGERAAGFVQAMRGEKRAAGQLETFLKQYSLSTEEGLALMTLAEALLRIPDKATANTLIKDKVSAADWLANIGDSGDWLAKAAGMGLAMTQRTLDSVLGRLGQPLIREAILKALRMMGKQFVMGETIEEAIKNAREQEKKGYRLSYDILGEGARTAAQAERYFRDYNAAIGFIGQAPQTAGVPRPGLSVKLSALHPRYSYSQADQCVPAMTERLLTLCENAAKHDITLTVDAEEVDRLEISLDIIEAALSHGPLSGWEGFGLAVQAYQKRALGVIEHLEARARQHGRRMQIRIVKGAYWDSEIKRAQVQGLPDYPVFTRKVNTDLSFLACTHRIFESGDHLYPMLATHNAHTAASVLELARGRRFEFQRLHGMGSSLHDLILRENLAPVTIYAPVGPHEDLLAYLVRRLLENGANTSFVNQALDDKIPAHEIVRDPVADAKASRTHRHPYIAMPSDIYKGEAQGRRNSSGFDLTDAVFMPEFLKRQQAAREKTHSACAVIGGRNFRDGKPEIVANPSNREKAAGEYYPADESLIEKAMRTAQEGFGLWSRTPSGKRAEALEKTADLFEKHSEELIALLSQEGGKTYADALAEVREAVDFCRYYANIGRSLFDEAGQALPGPTGESNHLRLVGRGVFVAISPWNFPLAIFTGQIAAALMAGNAVIAKPASLTPLVAMRAVELMHRAGIPDETLTFFPADGRVGGALTAHPQVAGVVFTGSTEVARQINRTLAAKDGPIVPLIAETGGLNAMIVDSSALPEQVVDDVITSAFTSAGQRCSALRILCLQEDVADKILTMLGGAMAELRIGPAGELKTDIGPVIDEKSRQALQAHVEILRAKARLIAQAPLSPDLAQKGFYFAPCAYELTDLSLLEREVFGPVLHVIRFAAQDKARLIDALNAKGYGLTFGLHTRLDSARTDVAESIHVGNIYVNRSMIGAVVGTQPFGGMGLSGTGPKAGGPYYLLRFAHEKTITVNTTASGGNATLVSLIE